MDWKSTVPGCAAGYVRRGLGGIVCGNSQQPLVCCCCCFRSFAQLKDVDRISERSWSNGCGKCQQMGKKGAVRYVTSIKRIRRLKRSRDFQFLFVLEATVHLSVACARPLARVVRSVTDSDSEDDDERVTLAQATRQNASP